MIVCLGCPGCQVQLLSPGTPLWMGATWLPISPMDNGESFRPIDAQASKICPGWGTLIEGGCYVVSIRLSETLTVLGSTVTYIKQAIILGGLDTMMSTPFDWRPSLWTAGASLVPWSGEKKLWRHRTFSSLLVGALSLMTSGLTTDPSIRSSLR